MSDTFLSRWSRLKSEAKADIDTPPPAAPAAEDVAAEPPPPDLPPIDTLTADSDFSPFLQAGVPEDLRRAALSRLWASDPLFSRPEVFDLHMEDYNAHPLGEVIRTAWKLGQGIVEDLAQADDPASFPGDTENTQIKTKIAEDGTSES